MKHFEIEGQTSFNSYMVRLKEQIGNDWSLWANLFQFLHGTIKGFVSD